MNRNRSTLLIPAIVLMAGCTSWHAKRADRDAYGTIYEGQLAALGKAYKFDIAYNPVECDPYLKEAEDETGCEVEVLTLEDALKVAFKNSRSFQTKKEDLYSSALSLANSSRGWETFLHSGSVNSTAEVERGDPGSPEEGGERTNQYISGDGNVSLSRRLVGGGLLTLGASLSFLTDFLGVSETQVGSLVEGSFTQPLLRGAWRGLAYEDQHRRERDFLMEVYEFERFRQTFAVDIMQEYYAVLTLKDVLENSRTNVERLRMAHLVTEAMVEGGQLTSAQEDQAEQDLLRAQISFEQTQLTYSNKLDNFKITLGLPISKELKLDYPGALKRLNEKGPQPLPFTEAAAASTAFITDTALLRARAHARDADRNVEIAADKFLPRLDLGLKVSVPGTNKEPWRLQTQNTTRGAKVTFNYDLDQTDNRVAYRNAMIARDRAKRSLQVAEETAILNVRNSFRSLKQAGESFKLEERSVAIAKRRTALVAIQRKQGQASTRDVLEAEAALNTSLNGLTSSLVSYTITRLKFLASLGMIEVDADGNLTERKTPFGYEQLQERYPYLKTDEEEKNGTVGGAPKEVPEQTQPKEETDES